jgi:hypothetical protein
MNCTRCDKPFDDHELIDGLCHRCTATRLALTIRTRDICLSENLALIKEHEATLAELAHLNAACAEMRGLLNSGLQALKVNPVARANVPDDQIEATIRTIEHAVSSTAGTGYVSRAEHDALNAKCAEMREALEFAGSHDHYEAKLEPGGKVGCVLCYKIDAALSTTAGTGYVRREDVKPLRDALEEATKEHCAMWNGGDSEMDAKLQRWVKVLQNAKAKGLLT